jgi:hypothetical protein
VREADGVTSPAASSPVVQSRRGVRGAWQSLKAGSDAMHKRLWAYAAIYLFICPIFSTDSPRLSDKSSNTGGGRQTQESLMRRASGRVHLLLSESRATRRAWSKKLAIATFRYQMPVRFKRRFWTRSRPGWLDMPYHGGNRAAATQENAASQIRLV